MWAASMPYYSEYKGRRNALDSKDGHTTASPNQLDEGSMAAQSMTDMLGPALDGPPSPERLRQVSKQAKHASHLRRTTGHRTVSSTSSSMRPGTSERPPWELALDSSYLARKASGRSAASSNASHDRESVLGRHLFPRRNKRESKSSSGSSMYSVDTSTDYSFVTGSTDKLSVPSLLTRLKPTKDEPAAQKKLQISGPFNFEHISSAKREHVPDPTVFPSAAPPQRPSFNARHTSPNPQRLLKQARSQDQLRSSPPRGLRSAQSRYRHEYSSSVSSPPEPPPRMSSQHFEEPSSLHRPVTSAGLAFRAPQPFIPSQSVSHQSPPATSHGYMPKNDADLFRDSTNRFSHALSTPDDAAWPLPTPEEPSYPAESPLEDVPEEEEHHYFGHRSRASQASINSSLRGSHSVPMLRMAAQRPMSGASDTLGQTASKKAEARPPSAASSQQKPGGELSGDWEDCIDYCYEHEADANFDYQWDRTSCDVDRPALGSGIEGTEFPGYQTKSATPQPPSPRDLHTSPTEASPAVVVHEDASLSPVRHNFSLPRGKPGLSHLAVRPISIAASFKESDGFTLSPSMLIPGDYHQAMLESANEEYEYEQQIPRVPYRNPNDGEFEASFSTMQQRSSTSTTESTSTAPSESTSRRHISANSTWTASTRLTSSTTSLTKLANSVAEQTKAMSPTSPTGPKDFFEQASSTIDADIDADVDADAVPDLVPFPTIAGPKRSGHKAHASESIVRDDILTMKSGGALPTRRARARTSSLGQQTPPIGQYALFPRTSHRPTGDRI